MEFDTFDIDIPYIVRFVWGSSDVQKEFKEKIFKSRLFLLNELPRILVHENLCSFAPTNNELLNLNPIGEMNISNHYFSRWNTMVSLKNNSPVKSQCHVYGKYDSKIKEDRWDTLRDLWQEALAPDCCKEAYFNSKSKDPYLELFGTGNSVKRIEDSSMNSFLAPLGLYISPIVPCNLKCKHALDKSKNIELIIKKLDNEIYETLKTIMDMPLKIDSYRGMALIDTPMFKGVYGTDALKDKKILKVKPNNTEFFDYSKDWVVRGNEYPYKGVFQ